MIYDLAEKLSSLGVRDPGSKPLLFDLSIEAHQKMVGELMSTGKVQFVSDDFKEQQQELFAIQNPTLVYKPDFKEKFESYFGYIAKKMPHWQLGIWVFYPWLSKIVHLLPEKDFLRVRTARNRNLITEEEQEKFYNATIGIGGLSVGSSVAFAIALQGGGKKFKLADMDRLALSNTNRILTGVDNLGVLKVEMAARSLYEINPFCDVEVYSEGITQENAAKFFSGLSVVIDELDNLAVKYLIREQASANRIAVVMAADNGDNAVVDVERYDLDPHTPFFHGRMGEVSYEMLSNLDKFGIGKMITKHVGPENVTERMQASLLEMGKTIVSWPQLGGAALINGAAVAYCVRKILNGQEIENDRALVLMDEMLVPSYGTKDEQERRKKASDGFIKIFNL